MATVFLATDLRHRRRVAIKVVHPELAQALGPERFLHEIEIAASLTHPHILPLLDSGVERHQAQVPEQGQLWYAMPYVEGESLRARLRRETQLPLADALRIARDVAAALAHAHEHGVIHRDIKPENILLAGDEAVVADFGVARAISAAGGERLTATGLAMGTPAYMSPEQAAGDRTLDGRSDLYSLGCVLYEMLAGEPPFSGPTPQAILAKRLNAPLPSLHVVRDAIPAEVEAAIERALARVPADRFATVAEFADALTLPQRTGANERPRRAGDRRRWVLPATAIALLALVLGAVLVVRSWTGAPPALDPDLLAVAPFDALSPELQPWSEGVVDVLSRSLDGAGALRTVSPTVSLRWWTGRADRASATALGRNTGAGLVVYGALERRGRDSIGIRAALLEHGGGQAPREVEVAGDTLRIDALVDSLSLALLRELGRTRPVGAVRRSPLGVGSLPALKAFLRGEQFYRQNLWDSALAQYDRAITLDSTFTLAYRRLQWVLGWYSSTAETFRRDENLVRQRAYRFAPGLAPRDSMLIVADSLSQAVIYDLRWGPLPREHFSNRRRLADVMAEAQRRYPSDPEIWYTIGEVRLHADDPALATHQEALGAFDQAISLDSAFAPAYIHAPSLAIEADLGDPERARRYLAAYLRLNPTDDHATPLRLTAELLDPARADLPEARQVFDTARADTWTIGVEYLASWPDSAETAVRLLRSLAFGEPDFTLTPADFFLRDSLFRRRILAFQLTRRGHLREAYRLYPVFGITPREQYQNPYDRLALLGAVPAETAAAVFRRVLEQDAPAKVVGLVPVLAWWFAQRDTASLRRFAADVDSMTRDDASNPAVNALRHYAADAARAYLTLARGDSAAALDAFASLADSVCGFNLLKCRSQKLTEARLLSARGEDRRAAELLDRWGELEPLAVLERARIAERLGEREKAMTSYRFVAAIWRHADPELQPYVQEARRGLERLLAER